MKRLNTPYRDRALDLRKKKQNNGHKVLSLCSRSRFLNILLFIVFIHVFAINLFYAFDIQVYSGVSEGKTEITEEEKRKARNSQKSIREFKA